MTPAELLSDAYGRLPGLGRAAVADLDLGALVRRPDLGAAPVNPIAWLVWHSARVQDDHLADVMGAEQLWTADGWARRFDLPLADDDIGYGHTAEQVSAVRAPADLLAAHLDAVTERTLAWLPTLAPEDLDRVVDPGWDPPVTLGARLVSVLQDCAQHLGQASYLRGMLGL
jgi:hypothetical protein